MKINIDPAEFVDRLEEQMAWLAVAGERACNGNRYEQRVPE